MTTENEKLTHDEIVYIAQLLGVELEDGQLTEEKKRETAECLAVLYELVYPTKKK